MEAWLGSGLGLELGSYIGSGLGLELGGYRGGIIAGHRVRCSEGRRLVGLTPSA